MNTERVDQSLASRLELLARRLERLERRVQVSGPWLSTADAAKELGKSPKAFWMWCARRKIVISNRMVARRDLDRALKTKKVG